MRAVLWGLALANLCVLQAAADLPVQADFDPSKVAGVWNSVGVTMDQGNRPKNGFQLHMKVVNNGDMSLILQSTEFGCRKVVDYFSKTDQPGIYTRRGTTTAVSILGTDHKNYAIIHAKTPEQNLVRLYVRRTAASEAEKKKFQNLATSLGFPAKNMEILPRVAQCPQ